MVRCLSRFSSLRAAVRSLAVPPVAAVAEPPSAAVQANGAADGGALSIFSLSLANDNTPCLQAFHEATKPGPAALVVLRQLAAQPGHSCARQESVLVVLCEPDLLQTEHAHPLPPPIPQEPPPHSLWLGWAGRCRRLVPSLLRQQRDTVSVRVSDAAARHTLLSLPPQRQPHHRRLLHLGPALPLALHSGGACAC